MQITKGFKYRIYPNLEQQALIDHQCFIYNQAYNICLNLQQAQWEINKDLDKQNRSYIKASEMDTKVKLALTNRGLAFKTVVTQQARINANKALESALKDKSKGFPKFKNSKLAKQSFNWNNQGFQILDSDNARFKILKLMRTPLQMRYHRPLPPDAKICAITISKSNNKYYVSFNVTYDNAIKEIKPDEVDLSTKAIGIDLNINDIALSNGELIKTHSKLLSAIKYDKAFKKLQRKQSRRVLKSKQNKVKLGKNFSETQRKLNAKFEKSKNLKQDLYHKITTKIVKEFDLIVVEDLNTKNMTKRAKLKNVKAKSGLNRSILNTSFYQLISMLEYKAKHNGKLFKKVNPSYTSKRCSVCGKINPNLSLADRVYICECGNTMHRDINASKNILELGLKSFGLGISLLDYKQKAFRVS